MTEPGVSEPGVSKLSQGKTPPSPQVPSRQFLKGAAELGLNVELIERPAARNLEDAAELLGLKPASIVKSMLVRHKDGSFLFALVPGDRKISWKKLRALVGVNKLSMPDGQTALQATGYVPGTITPIGARGQWPVYLDSAATGRVYLGAGAHGFSSAVDAGDLARALNARIADFTELA